MLIFAGKQLEDHDILYKCGVRTLDTLHLVLVSAGAAALQMTWSWSSIIRLKGLEHADRCLVFKIIKIEPEGLARQGLD